MARVTPEEFQEKQARNLKNSIPDIVRGVERVSEAPTLKAAAKKDKMLAGVTAAVNSGKWEAGLKRVSLEEWKTKMIDKGTGRIAAGIDGARDKTIAFAAELLPFQDNLKAKVDKMPDVTLEDSINRMTTFVRGMANFKRSK